MAACLWWTQRTMCTSSIVHASSEALPLLMSGHVCHLIVFSPPYATHPPSLSLPSHQLCVSPLFFCFLLFRCHITEHNWGSADWMIEPTVVVVVVVVVG